MGWRRFAGLGALVVLAALLLVPAGANASCEQVEAKHEPPCNPALPDSPWSVSHRNSYAQASSPFPGLESPKVITKHVDLPGIPIQLQFSDRYEEGGRVVWGSLLSANDHQGVFKLNGRTGRIIDVYIPAEREEDPPPSTVGSISGAYNLLDRDGHFIVPRGRYIDVFHDSVAGDRDSPIELRKRYQLPDSAFCGEADRVAGATMTFDNYVAFVTEEGMVNTIPRRPAGMRDANLRTFSINGEKCADPDVAPEDLEEISNSIAADEDGGIYVVTSKRMRRFDHDADANALTSAWSAPYNPGSEQSEIRLGAGSGSTPTLMGTGKQDKLVAISDGQDLMHVDLFWRDGIPKDWDGMGGDRPRRMACEFPVTFGDPDAETSLSEQSLTVRGYATFNVQNLLNYDDFPDGIPPAARNVLAALRGGDPEAAPYGAERIDWNPRKRKCESKWANEEVSIPNGIPTMSAASGLAYGIGQRDGFWGLEALDWRTGESEFFARASEEPCSDRAIGYVKVTPAYPIFGPVLDELSRSCENSTYAATEIGPGGTIWSGTFLGVSLYRPKP
jgi:hypothetical protein